MSNRQVVVITGKVCSGKTGLADLLSSEFQFKVIRSQELLENYFGNDANLDDRTLRYQKEIEVDHETNFRWLVDGVCALRQNKEYAGPIVIDSLTSIEQVHTFRNEFKNDLTHVHLYAKNETLLSRFQSKCSRTDAEAFYNSIDHLKERREFESLAKDADVRIFTTRCDAKDILARVAARLHLYAPPDYQCVDVLIGGQYGSEGKGNVVSYLAREYDLMVRVGGPNAGHTVANENGSYTYHHLPSGCRDVNARLLLGPGMTIQLGGLLKEIKDCNISADRLFIDPQATIIEDSDIKAEGQLVTGIASTGSGSGAAAARRILDRHTLTFKMARDVEELRPYVGVEGNYHGSTIDRLEEAYRKRQSVLLEGTQGSGLSIFHGTYPYVTSRDTNVAGCLAEAGISPRRVRRIMMVVRPMPIRVGDPDGDQNKTSGPLKHSTTFDEIAQESGLDAAGLHKAEKTSTTHRKRRVGWFEWDQFRKACALNAPTDIILTFVDYLKSSNKEARRFEQLETDTIKFIEELECVSKAPVSLINTRFQREPEVADDFRSVIDRRSWTAKTTTPRNKWTKPS